MSRSSSPSVHLLFKEVPSASPTVFGPLRPLIGVVATEDEAAAAEAANPGLGVSWETFPVRGAAGGSAPERVWAVVTSSCEDPGDDPDVQAVFASADGALSSPEGQADGSAVWELEVGAVDPGGRPWRAL
ncbi:hypothetical protein [Brachybacterium sp. NPDC056505]|uniref:hypothetical protein n=1 Tax=Brachybacterium sp. NPDC056505 TaxID=3345843 RepID=UPI00366F4FEC